MNPNFPVCLRFDLPNLDFEPFIRWEAAGGHRYRVIAGRGSGIEAESG